jgi:hypothetical protein|tara:strand:- start:310 stop:693 length:384 start_codon:yes stop_codon:yes gene_type:complete
MKMKIKILLLLIFPLFLVANEPVYELGSTLESNRSSTIVLFNYRTDAFRLETARDFSLDRNDFIRQASIDVRDIYKAKRGDVIRLEESLRNGKIFKVVLLSDKVRRKEYFVLSRDLKKLSLLSKSQK